MRRNDSCNFRIHAKKELNFYSQLLYKPVIIMQKISAKGWGYHDRYGGLP